MSEPIIVWKNYYVSRDQRGQRMGWAGMSYTSREQAEAAVMSTENLVCRLKVTYK